MCCSPAVCSVQSSLRDTVTACQLHVGSHNRRRRRILLPNPWRARRTSQACAKTELPGQMAGLGGLYLSAACTATEGRMPRTHSPGRISALCPFAGGWDVCIPCPIVAPTLQRVPARMQQASHLHGASASCNNLLSVVIATCPVTCHVTMTNQVNTVLRC